MTAPHTHQPTPPQAPPHPAPPVEPEEQPGPSRARWIAGIVVLAVVGGLVGWSLLSADGGTIDLDPNRPEASTDPPPETEPDSAPADDGADAELAELRATDRYLAIAEHERARAAEPPVPGDEAGAAAWAIFDGRGYVNEEALWDDVVGPIRDDALLAGEPYTEPIWDEEYPTPAYIPVGWTDETTQGRGDAMTFAVRFVDAAAGEPVERFHAVLIRTGADGAGELVARMDPFDLRRGDAPDFPSAHEEAYDRVWEWVQEQPRSER